MGKNTNALCEGKVLQSTQAEILCNGKGELRSQVSLCLLSIDSLEPTLSCQFCNPGPIFDTAKAKGSFS